MRFYFHIYTIYCVFYLYYGISFIFFLHGESVLHASLCKHRTKTPETKMVPGACLLTCSSLCPLSKPANSYGSPFRGLGTTGHHISSAYIW